MKPGGFQIKEPPFRTGWELARFIAVSGIAGLIAGVAVGGLGSRLFMRIAGALGGRAARGATTEAGFTVGEITFAATMELVVFVGIFVGIVGAALYVVFRPWLGWAGPWRGLAFGVVLFAIGSASSDVLDPSNFDFALLGNPGLLVALIVALFLAYGVTVDRAFVSADRRLPPADPDHPGARVAYGAITALGAFLGIVLLVQTMFTRNSCDCDPPVIAGIFAAAAAVGTLLWWATAFTSGVRHLPTTARTLGLTGLVGTTALGLVRAISDAADILGG